MHAGQVIATHVLLQRQHQQSIQKVHYAGLLRYQESLKAQEKEPPRHDPYWKDTLQMRDLAVYDKCSLGEKHAV